MAQVQNEPTGGPSNFIRDIMIEDLKTGKVSRIQTRFPPEPNGYLHIGHAKAICLDFGLPAEFGGGCNLRMDDTNPSKEETEYVESIQEDVRWLGFDWGDRLYYASDYFDQLYDWAVQLIKAGKAYVCDLTADQMREYRGTLSEPGKDSPWRNRTVEENLDLFERMKNGEFADGTRTLRAKIDMASKNLNMRDPVMYRIAHSITTALAIRGVSIRCTITRTVNPIRSRVSRTPCARSSSKITARCTTGSSSNWGYFLRSNRIRSSESHVYASQQAKAVDTRARRSCERLGRSADADSLRDPASWIHAGGDPELLCSTWECRRRMGLLNWIC